MTTRPPISPLFPYTTLFRSVNDQVRALLGDGVDLCFCIVRPDYVAHALEEAQHMERISLTDGLDDPAHRPEVDRSEEHTSELQSLRHLVCRLLLEKKKRSKT